LLPQQDPTPQPLFVQEGAPQTPSWQ
jgi:hypothetical protein